MGRCSKRRVEGHVPVLKVEFAILGVSVLKAATQTLYNLE